MASSKKTKRYGLNQWYGTDVPKREDFVKDNEIIDNVMATHADDTSMHLTPEDRLRFDELIFRDTYIGDNAMERTFELPFQPILLIIFTVSSPINRVDFTAKTHDLNFGFYAAGCSSWGIDVSGKTLTVRHSVVADFKSELSTFNSKGSKYVYVAFR